MTAEHHIWVLIPTTTPEDLTTGLELLNPGRKLARQSGMPLTALVMGSGTGETARQAIAMGADQVLLADNEAFSRYDTDCFFHALVSLVEQHRPLAILIPATDSGRDLAPRLACRFRTGLTADCTGIAMEPDGVTVAWTRPALGGNLMATILCRDTRPQMGTIRPGVFPPNPQDPTRTGNILPVESPDLPSSRVALMSLIRNLQDAERSTDIIVSGGLGMGSAENFQWIHRLAQVLGGTVGASRGAVREGWAPYARQIGQSGRTVRPKLYIACGISGAVQHLAGISGAQTVIAINSDADAPIFQSADYGIVGDVMQILPELVNLLEQSKKGALPHDL